MSVETWLEGHIPVKLAVKRRGHGVVSVWPGVYSGVGLY